jgi:c(7)-type cytochrome triheme protein
MLRFDHSKHPGIACEVCHRGILSQSNATIPAQSLCAKCHNVTPDKSTAGIAIWQKGEDGTRYTWPVSYRLPAHVYFSHRRHVEIARLTCENCHGDMSRRTEPVVTPLKQLVMNDCIVCHKGMKASTDCTGCHR